MPTTIAPTTAAPTTSTTTAAPTTSTTTTAAPTTTSTTLPPVTTTPNPYRCVQPCNAECRTNLLKDINKLNNDIKTEQSDLESNQENLNSINDKDKNFLNLVAYNKFILNNKDKSIKGINYEIKLWKNDIENTRKLYRDNEIDGKKYIHDIDIAEAKIKYNSDLLNISEDIAKLQLWYNNIGSDYENNKNALDQTISELESKLENLNQVLKDKQEAFNDAKLRCDRLRNINNDKVTSMNDFQTYTKNAIRYS